MRETRILAIVLIFIIASVNAVQAQEENYELFWSYEIGGDVPSVSVSPDGSYIAVGSGDKFVYLFNKDGKLLWSYDTGLDVISVSISSDGNYTAVGNFKMEYFRFYDSYVKFLDSEGKLLWNYELASWVRDVSVSSDGAYIAVGEGMKYYGWGGRKFGGRGGKNGIDFIGLDGKLLWSYETSSETKEKEGGNVINEDYINAVSVSSNGSYIVAGSREPDKKVYFFNRKGWLLWSYETRFSVGDAAISSDGSYIVVSVRNAIYFFNREGKLLWTYDISDYDINAVSISLNGSYIAAGSYKKVNLFNKVGELLWSYDADKIKSISISSDGSYIVAGSQDKKVYFFVSKKMLAQIAISAAIEHIESAKSNNFYIVEPESYLFQADQEFKAGNYSKAKSLAEQANALAETISRESTPVKIAIDISKSTISQEKAKGFKVDKAESILLQAEQSFKIGNYSIATNFANQSKALALDMDSDGIPNDYDFASSINNYYIYSGVVIFLVGSVITIRASLKRREKLRLEGQRLSEEQQRREKEIIGQEKESRLRLEKIKLEILCKIEKEVISAKTDLKVHEEIINNYLSVNNELYKLYDKEKTINYIGMSIFWLACIEEVYNLLLHDNDEKGKNLDYNKAIECLVKIANFFITKMHEVSMLRLSVHKSSNDLLYVKEIIKKEIKTVLNLANDIEKTDAMLDSTKACLNDKEKFKVRDEIRQIFILPIIKFIDDAKEVKDKEKKLIIAMVSRAFLEYLKKYGVYY